MIAERRLREVEEKVRAHEEKNAREEQELEALRREVARLRPKGAKKRGSLKMPAMVIAGATVAAAASSGTAVKEVKSSKGAWEDRRIEGSIPLIDDWRSRSDAQWG